MHHRGSKCHLALMAVKRSPLVTAHYCYNTPWHMESITKADVPGRENLTNLKVKTQSDMVWFLSFFWVTRSEHGLGALQACRKWINEVVDMAEKFSP